MTFFRVRIQIVFIVLINRSLDSEWNFPAGSRVSWKKIYRFCEHHSNVYYFGHIFWFPKTLITFEIYSIPVLKYPKKKCIAYMKRIMYKRPWKSSGRTCCYGKPCANLWYQGQLFSLDLQDKLHRRSHFLNSFHTTFQTFLRVVLHKLVANKVAGIPLKVSELLTKAMSILLYVFQYFRKWIKEKNNFLRSRTTLLRKK